MQLYQPTITGSLAVSGSVTINGPMTVVSGSLSGTASLATTASYAVVANSASYAASASNALSASNAVTAQTASYANALTVAGTLTAQTLVVQTITSSVDYVTGSTQFGSLLTNTHVFSGSVTMNPGGLFVSSSGYVGIGTTNPSKLLTINSPSNVGDGLRTEKNGTITSFLGDGGSAVTVGILQMYSGSSSIENIRIYTDGNSWFNGGNVGIGTTNPTFKLDVQGGNANFSGTVNISNLNRLQWNGGDVAIANTGSFNLAFLTYNGATLSEAMRITSAGRVGIGNTSPISALVVATSSNTGSIGQSGIVIEGSSTLTTGSIMALAFTAIPGTSRARAAVGSVVGSDWGKGNLVFYTRDASDSTALTTADERMRITSGGNVGIGTISPNVAGFGGRVLTIAASTGTEAALELYGSLTTDDVIGALAYSNVNASGDKRVGQISVFREGGNDAANMRFYTKSGSLAERIRITSGGNIGIGTTTPNFSSGSSGSSIVTISATTSARNGIIELNGTRVNSTDISSYIRFFNNAAATPLADIRAIRGSSDTAGDLAFTTSNVERFRIADSGVKFQNGSSYLNYYEEGTFTPSSVGSNFSSISVVYGKYVRIGNQVTVNCKWTVTPGGTGRNYIVFNLPFAFAFISSNGFTGAVSNYNEGFSSSSSSNVGTTVRNSSGSDTQQYVEAVYLTTGANTSLQLMMTYFTF